MFGAPHNADPEGAREVVGHWKGSKADAAHAAGPDYRAMNKLATVRCACHARQTAYNLASLRDHAAACKTDTLLHAWSAA